MKTTAKMIAVMFLLGAGMLLAPKQSQAYVRVSYQLFYDELSPYGTWMNTPEYGMVWVPDAGPDFQPYASNGTWGYSNFGWMWVSDYPWGWAPFHYGRWYFDNRFGWAWVPGYDWAPAWVSWRVADGYYGWAPLMPGFRISLYYTWNMIPMNYWIFVHDRDFGCRDLNRYALRGWDHDRMYRHSHFMEGMENNGHGHRNYFTGPRVEQVRGATGRDFRPRDIRADERPVLREKTAPVPRKDNGTINREWSRRDPVVAPRSNERQPEFRPPVRKENNRNEGIRPPERQQNNRSEGFRPQPAPQQTNPYAERNVRPEPRQQKAPQNVQRTPAPRSEKSGQKNGRR
jgi:hypothetical protein